MPVYSKPSSDFISSKIGEEVHDYLFIPMYNLSSILGDDNGKLNKSQIHKIVTNVSIKPPGVLDSISEDILNSNTEYDFDLGQDPFYTEMNYSSFLTYYSIQNYLQVSEGKNVSPLLQTGNMAEHYSSAICFLYISCLDMYLQILDYKEIGKIKTSERDIKNIESNIRWVSARLNPDIHYEILTVLRELHRIVLVLRNLNFLFKE